MVTPPADIPARELSVGRVFERAVATIRHHLLAASVLALLFGALPTLAFEYALIEVDTAGGPEPGLPALVAQLAILILLWGLVAGMAQAALTRAVVAESKGQQRASLADSILDVVRVAPTLIALSLITGLAVSVGLTLLVVPGAIFWVMWSVAIPVLVVERPTIAMALHRSSMLTKDVRWIVFGVLLVLAALGIAASAAVEVVTGEWDNEEVGSILNNPAYLVLSILSNTVVSGFSASVIASLYVELRNAKEGPTTESLEQIFA